MGITTLAMVVSGVAAVALSTLFWFGSSEVEWWKKANSVYDFSAIDIDGRNVSLSEYRGRVLIMVNVASERGLAKTNYPQFKVLHEELHSQGLSILAFPCNQFMNQEPGDRAQIKSFIRDKYQCNIDIMDKINVNGDDAHPLWKYLKYKKGGFLVDAIKWNYTKFVIDRNGQVVARHGPQEEPFSFRDEVERLLAASPAQ